MKREVSIFWFRRDLRIKDNMALYWSLKNNKNVLPIFIFDDSILKKIHKDDQRIKFIHDSLSNLRDELISYGSDIHTFHEKPLNVWKHLVIKYNIQAVYSNEDYEPYSIKRDNLIEQFLIKKGIKFYQYKDHCIFAKNDILKNDGKPYIVYTAYKNKWLQSLTPNDISSISSHKYVKNFIQDYNGHLIELEDLGFNSPQTVNFPPRRIKKSIIKKYHLNRDIPCLDATSHLGLHIRFGTVSIRKLVQVAYENNEVWLSELIWREFFIQILYHFPNVTKESFREKYRNIKWRNSKKEFKKWCNGQTGFPLVDAGMRELNETGHMHNRVRMVVASFLVKDLLIDWRWGEEYFAQKLLDFELASNNGNWQWAAGTGCDASPYFRIFNPTTQLKKFDPELTYVRKWVPEYGTQDYYDEMVDHNSAYHRAIATYKASL
ncbi:MAG: deoxyribodipyrimidine photolyase [Bacteriovorax sp. MedPE-SWde]|nr:MAG: deoxyribodipyrimidine photolyase [Bacteriovorax sp. MedPE-SWde]